MPPTERITYFAYHEGIDPNILRLGTLVLDYANPKTSPRPYFHEEIKGLLDPKKPIASQDARPFCAMMYSQNRNTTLDVGIKHVTDIGRSSQGANTSIVIGTQGAKTELIEREKFFVDHLLKGEKARMWFQAILSVSKWMSGARAVVGNIVAGPQIWLLTGIYTITDATVYSIRSESTSHNASAKAPLPEPTGLAGLTGLTVGVRVSLGSGIQAEATTRINGSRVWAAQWVKVKAKYIAAKLLESDTSAITRHLKLTNVYSAGTERTSKVPTEEPPKDETSMLELELEDEDGNGTVEADLDDVQWKAFERKFNEVLEELEEDAC